jgi:hypothetical protein
LVATTIFITTSQFVASTTTGLTAALAAGVTVPLQPGSRADFGSG